MPHVVVGIDGSAASRDALRWAEEYADATGATLDALCAWHYPVVLVPVSNPAAIRPHEEAERVLARTVHQALGDRGSGHIRQLTLEGKAADVLAHASLGAQLLVVGTRGKGNVIGSVLGSVSQKVVEHAACPVVVVPAAPRHAISVVDHQVPLPMET